MNDPTRRRLPLVALAAASLLGACSSTTVVRAVQYESLPAYAQARADLPARPANALRLLVYRPQALTGMWGSAVVYVNGRPMGNPADPIRDNRLLPGAVFVVDVPAGSARVTWAQGGRAEGTDAPIELSAAGTPVAYLRWTLRPTHGLLEPVSEAQGAQDVASLRFSGYVSLAAR